MRSRIASLGLSTIALIAVVGCSGSSGGSAAPAVSASAPSSAETSASTAPSTSAGAPSEAAASEPAASAPITQYTFPSEAKELEALIPGTICGATVQKLSLKGKDVFSADNEAAAGIEAVLNSVGKTTADVSAAAAFPLAADSECSVIIIRVDGANEGQMTDLLKAEAAKENQTFTETTLGGKTVYQDDPTKFGYTYIKGDGVIILTAGSQKDAEELIAQLP